MSKKLKIIAILVFLVVFVTTFILTIKLFSKLIMGTSEISVDLTNLKYTEDTTNDNLKTYTQDDFESFLSDYNNNSLPKVYVTEFLFDGVSMYKPYDLDDFVSDGNDTAVDALTIKVLNINATGNITLSGSLTGMLAINTNDAVGNTNIILNNATIDTDSKKVPAIYVYNKDITYTGNKVTIKTVKDTSNYLEGGKLKKVSLIPSDNLDEYTSKYQGDVKTNYGIYTNYYGIYTTDEIKNILFATVTADNEDLSDGDPYYYYKASGAISSDIDLYFEGEGYLEVTSKNKEGIETKGNLTFDGGTGDYVVNAEDDCLNTTTDNKENANARNTLTINVNSMYAIVSNDADEGDAIDSNGELIINGGTIIAIAKPGQDAGIDSETGTYINGGRVLATCDMYDEIKESSKQRFIVLSFVSRPVEDDLITLLDSSDNVIFAYQTDRTYSYLIYSDSTLSDSTYYLYKNGTIEGDNVNGFYTTITSYEKGTSLAYNNKGNTGMQGGPNDNGNPPAKPDENNTPPSMNGEPPEKPNDDNMPGGGMDQNMNSTASNKEFTIEGISNVFNGVATYQQ